MRRFVVARTSGDPVATAGAMRREVQAMDRLVPVYSVGTLRDQVDNSLAVSRAAAAFVGLFAAVALLLASVGLYGVVSFTVSQRTAEVGIRKAFGAGRWQVTQLLMRDVLVRVLAGIVVGTGLSLIATPVLESFLVGVRPTDPLTIAVVATILLAVATTAAAIPASIAARADPMASLRRD